jgi:hypothetical protein
MKAGSRTGDPGSEVGRRRWAIGTLGLAAAICLAFSGALALGGMSGAANDGDGDDDLELTRAALEQWIETRRLISKERLDWALGKEMLTDRVRLVEHKIETLRKKIGEAEASIAEADKKRADLIAENERLKRASSALEATVLTLESRTKALLERLPDPICERVKPLSQQLPKDPKATRLSLSERFQNVVGILNEVNKFNREIHLTSEVRKLADGTTAEVTALYVGIGQAYYVSGNKKAAGVGTASDEGWVWTPKNEAAREIARAISILKNEEAADFVPLPIVIK